MATTKASAASTRFDEGVPAALNAALIKEFFACCLALTNKCVSRNVIRQWQVIAHP